MAVNVCFVVVFVNFLAFSPVVTTALSTTLFTDTGKPGVVFTSHLVFETTAPSTIDCANQCRLHGNCKTFTFTENGSCRGNSRDLDLMTADTANETGARTYQMDPCAARDYLVVTDSRRLVNNGVLLHPEIDLGFSDSKWPAWQWYRFMVNDTLNAFVVDYCVKDPYALWFPVWLDLMGRPAPHLHVETEGRACVWNPWLDEDDWCCNFQSAAAVVRNCGDFFIYKLGPTPNAYCAYSIRT